MVKAVPGSRGRSLEPAIKLPIVVKSCITMGGAMMSLSYDVIQYICDSEVMISLHNWVLNGLSALS